MENQSENSARHVLLIAEDAFQATRTRMFIRQSNDGVEITLARTSAEAEKKLGEQHFDAVVVGTKAAAPENEIITRLRNGEFEKQDAGIPVLFQNAEDISAKKVSEFLRAEVLKGQGAAAPSQRGIG